MTGAPDGVAVDLDAARRARAEKLGNPKAVVGGRAYAMRADLPMAAYFVRAEALKAETAGERDAAARELVEMLLLDPSEADAFLANHLSIWDLIDVVDSYTPVGESPASAPPSKNGGKRSRPTSKRTTASTSRARSSKNR